MLTARVAAGGFPPHPEELATQCALLHLIFALVNPETSPIATPTRSASDPTSGWLLLHADFKDDERTANPRLHRAERLAKFECDLCV